MEEEEEEKKKKKFQKLNGKNNTCVTDTGKFITKLARKHNYIIRKIWFSKMFCREINKQKIMIFILEKVLKELTLVLRIQKLDWRDICAR